MLLRNKWFDRNSRNIDRTSKHFDRTAPNLDRISRYFDRTTLMNDRTVANSDRTSRNIDRISMSFDRTLLALFWQNHIFDRTFRKIWVWQNSKSENVLSKRRPFRRFLSYTALYTRTCTKGQWWPQEQHANHKTQIQNPKHKNP